MTRLPLLIVFSLLLAACAGITADEDTSYPKEPDDMRRAQRGKITGPEGITLFGGSKSNKSEAAAYGSGVSVNRYLWKATLDTISFMPLASTDPFGGVIITDWYEAPQNPGERFKLHVVIRDRALRSDAISVNMFKQEWDAKTSRWRDAATDKSLSDEFENIILTRARELRVRDQG